jgi:uncharacterized membrane protein
MYSIMTREKLLRILSLIGLVLAMLYINALRKQGVFVNPENVYSVLSLGFVFWVIVIYSKR